MYIKGIVEYILSFIFIMQVINIQSQHAEASGHFNPFLYHEYCNQFKSYSSLKSVTQNVSFGDLHRV